MTNDKYELARRVLPFVTFVLLSGLISGKLVCARPQDNSQNNNSNVADETAEKVESLSDKGNDRYKSILTQTKEKPASVVHSGLNLTEKFLKNMLNEAWNCSSTNVLSIDKLRRKIKRITNNLNQIKIKIKTELGDELDSFFNYDILLLLPLKQIKSKRDLIYNHFKLFIFIAFLRFFTYLKSSKLQEQCVKYAIKMKHTNAINKNYNVTSCYSNAVPRLCSYKQIKILTENIFDDSFSSLVSISKNSSECSMFVKNMRKLFDSGDKFSSHIRLKRNSIYKRKRKKNVYNNSSNNYIFVLKSKTPGNANDKISSSNYIDNKLKETLIRNFLKHSLPDLQNEYYSADKLSFLNQNIYPESVHLSHKADLLVHNIIHSAIPLPRPEPVYVSSHAPITAPPMQFDTFTELHSVPLITSKPRPYKSTPKTTIIESHTSWSSTLAPWTSTVINHNHYASNSTYPDHLSSSYPVTNNDPFLQFPYPTIKPISSSFLPPKQEHNTNEPYFVEPIVVSSVDKLPSNYPIPVENTSMGHNPVTVLIGSKPPEIVLFEDSFHPQQGGMSASGDATDSSAGAAADPAASGSDIGPAIAAAAAATAAAGAGGLGLLAAGIGGPAAAIVGGAGAAVGAASSASGGAGITGTGEFQIGTDSDSTAIASNQESAISDNDSEDLELHQLVALLYTELMEAFSYFFSLEFISDTVSALYSLAIPHVSFLLTSGFTAIAFLFPWLYPHIVIPLVNSVTSVSARFINDKEIVVRENISPLLAESLLSDEATEKSNNDQTQTILEDTNIEIDSDYGRASAAEISTKPNNAMVNALKSITKPIFSGEATDMIITDIRTPPKIKSQMAQAQIQSLHAPGKGEVIPVVLEGNDEAALEKISSDNFKYTHNDATPSSGLSTWILLNSDTVSTPVSHHKKPQKPIPIVDAFNITTENMTDGKKKPPKIPMSVGTTTEKIVKTKVDTIIIKKPDRKPIATIQKVNQTLNKKPPVKLDPEENTSTTTNISLQDYKFKNKTPVVVGKVPVTTKEFLNITTTPMSFLESPPENNTRLGTPVVTFPHVPIRQKPLSIVSTRKPSMTPNQRPTIQIISNISPNKSDSELLTSLLFPIVNNNSDSSVIEGTSPETSVETTTIRKSQTVISKKKKKKNKNKTKRRRPGKKPATNNKVQSKVTEDDNSTSSKLPGLPTNRPLSTRIYNYLAREVMPNVGVGLVGLMLTAGLAGLLLYPFGGAIPVRRNYEKPNPSYNLNDYPSVNEIDNAQPEESVLSQVLAGMSNTISQYSREQPDVIYKTVPKYKPARFENTNGYNAHKEVKYSTEGVAEEKFSELGDVVSGPHESVKFTNFDINDSIKYPIENSQPNPSYSTIDLTNSNSQKDPIPYHKFNSPNDTPIKPESSYSTLGEYASYNNPSDPIKNPVYSGDTYDYKNHKNDDTQEFKVSSELEVVTQLPENQTSTTSNVHKGSKHEPSFAALEGIPKNYRTLQTSIRFEDSASVLPMNQEFVSSDGIYTASVEHGPRNIKLESRRKRNIANENELDSILTDTEKSFIESTHSPVQFITADSVDKISHTTQSNNNYSENFTVYFTAAEMKKNSSSSIPEPIQFTSDDGVRINEINQQEIESNMKISTNSKTSNSIFTSNQTNNKVENINTNNLGNTYKPVSGVNLPNEVEGSSNFSFSSFLKKVLDFKLRMGMELLRATSDVLNKYLGAMQQRMVETLRDLQRSTMRVNTINKDTNKVIKKNDKKDT